jgi:hypothetical protein
MDAGVRPKGGGRMPRNHGYPLKADRWILPQAKSNVLIRHGWPAGCRRE